MSVHSNNADALCLLTAFADALCIYSLSEYFVQRCCVLIETDELLLNHSPSVLKLLTLNTGSNGTGNGD